VLRTPFRTTPQVGHLPVLFAGKRPEAKDAWVRAHLLDGKFTKEEGFSTKMV